MGKKKKGEDMIVNKNISHVYDCFFSISSPAHLSWSEAFKSSDGELVVGADLVIV